MTPSTPATPSAARPPRPYVPPLAHRVRIDHAYTPAAGTDIRKTFARFRRQQRADEVAQTAVLPAVGSTPRGAAGAAQVLGGQVARLDTASRHVEARQASARDFALSRGGEPRDTRRGATSTPVTLCLFNGRAA